MAKQSIAAMNLQYNEGLTVVGIHPSKKTSFAGFWTRYGGGGRVSALGRAYTPNSMVILSRVVVAAAHAPEWFLV